MILKVAWRNIWRSRIRSIIVLSSIAIGIWAGLVIIGFSFGMNNERTAAAIGATLGHSQAHHRAFIEDPQPSAVLSEAAIQELETTLDAQNFVTGYAKRTVLQGMVASPKKTRATRIIGVDAEAERKVTTIPSYMIEGDFFESKTRKGVVISEKLAKKMGLGMRKKLVLTFQDQRGIIHKATFRVSGIYRTLNAAWDELNLYVQQDDIEKIVGGSLIHEVLISYDKSEDTEQKTQAIVSQVNGPTVITSWKENSPELGFADDMMGIMLVLVLGIIMLALLFGIINNMLMAVLERRRELGMLMAVGMNKRKVFLMILLETLMLGVVAGPIGIVLGDVTVRAMMQIGLDLSTKKDGLAELGVGSVIYPEIVPEYYVIIAIMVITTALIASLFPAYKALKLNPVAAIRGN
ncbi:MAG: ABC transporter permease [Schleiferiaceae bacterium]